MATVQDQLFDFYVSQAIDLNRLSEDLRKKIVQILERVKKEVSEKLLVSNLTEFNKKKLKQLEASIELTLKSGFSDLSSLNKGHLEGLIDSESSFFNKTLNTVLSTTYFSKYLNKALLREIATDSIIQGAPNAEWWSRISADIQQKFIDQIRIGLLQGESLDQIIKRIRGRATGKVTTYLDASGNLKRWYEYKGGIMEMTTRQAEALARTSLLTVANRMKSEMFRLYPEVIKGKQQSSILDNRTTVHCIEYDGKTWSLDNEPIGHDLIFVDLPAHWNCRSIWIAWLKKYSEINSKIRTQFPEEMDGTVSGRQTGIEWFKKQSASFQEEALGKGKYRIWKEQGLSLRDLIDQRGNELTLKEFRLKYE